MSEKEIKAGNPVKGFVILKCPHCGEARVSFFRQPQSAFRCFRCKRESPADLNEMRTAYTKCPCCENELVYRTNFTAEYMEVPCKKCGAPIDCRLDADGTAYNTI